MPDNAVFSWLRRLWPETPRGPRREEGGGVCVSLDELLALRFQSGGLDLSSRRKVMTLMAGGWQSGLHGRGMDFEETRHYLPGDDIRALDWRVTARTGHPHTKVFREERERPVFILADYGPSMRFGTRVAFKSVIAARAAALLAWAAAVHGDRVGGQVFAARGHRESKPAAGKRGVLRLLHVLAQDLPAAPAPDGQSALAQSLLRARRVARPGSLVCVLSDFHGLDRDARSHLKQLARHCDILGVHIYDPLEQDLPPPGAYAVSDGVDWLRLDSADPGLRAAYRARFEQRHAELDALFTQRGLRLLSLSTRQDVAAALRRGLGRVEPASGRSHAAELEA